MNVRPKLMGVSARAKFRSTFFYHRVCLLIENPQILSIVVEMYVCDLLKLFSIACHLYVANASGETKVIAKLFQCKVEKIFHVEYTGRPKFCLLALARSINLLVPS